jgi:hypothetical protein
MKQSIPVGFAMAVLLAGAAPAQYGPYRGYGIYYEASGAPVADAVARRYNVETDMLIDGYITSCYENAVEQRRQRLKHKRQVINETQEESRRRLREKPDPDDVDQGSALNVILADLLNP